MNDITGRKDINAPFKQPESIRAIDMYTGEVTEARRDDILLSKKAYEKPKLKKVYSKIIVTMETCEDGIKEEKKFASLDELQWFLDTQYNPYVYSITSIKEIAEYERI